MGEGEETGPLANLPPADRTLLAHAPLEVAVAEVRFEASVPDISPEFALRLKGMLAALGHTFAGLQRVQMGQLAINLVAGAQVPAVPQMQPVSGGWQLASSDTRVLVTIMPSAVVIQTSNYVRWSESIKPVLESLLSVVGEALAPKLVGRIGLRYVDRFVDSSARTPQAWRGRIDEHLLGPIDHGVVGGLVKSAQQQIEFRLGEAQGALMRHGAFLDAAVGGAISYLLDVDVFDAEALTFDAATVVKRAEILNRTAASLFQLALTGDYLRELQGNNVVMSTSDPPPEV